MELEMYQMYHALCAAFNSARQFDTPLYTATIEDMAKYLVRQGFKQGKWIPVSELLPEIGVPVLVTYLNAIDGTPQGDGVAVQLFGENCWYWWEGSAEDCDCEVRVEITHWMPLPEPPKEEQP